ncbi:MAG: phytanoyl-CoA dioxygenase family protein [Pseudomonadota bacterium]
MTVTRFNAVKDEMPSAAMVDAYHRDGFLVIEDFCNRASLDAILNRATELVDGYDPEDTSIFETEDQSHAADDYFRTSGDKIRFFFERDAFDRDGKLVVDKQGAVNKIGHALHDLDPVFSGFSRDPRLAALANGLGLKDAGLVQSMFIVKAARIGGEVNCHQDATFLYTDPITCTGFWFALEDATLENGCLQAVPGAHTAPLTERFRYVDGDLMMEERVPPAFDDTDVVPLEVPAGTLIVLHGLLPHLSGPNTSEKSRRAYALHVVDRAAKWADDNWLVRGPDMPVRGFEVAA